MKSSISRATSTWQTWRQAFSCGEKRIANGEPIGLVTKAGAVYVLTAEEHDPRRRVGFRKAASDNFAKVMTVTGGETTVNGIKAVYVQGYVGKLGQAAPAPERPEPCCRRVPYDSMEWLNNPRGRSR